MNIYTGADMSKLMQGNISLRNCRDFEEGVFFIEWSFKNFKKISQNCLLNCCFIYIFIYSTYIIHIHIQYIYNTYIHEASLLDS